MHLIEKYTGLDHDKKNLRTGENLKRQNMIYKSIKYKLKDQIYFGA